MNRNLLLLFAGAIFFVTLISMRGPLITTRTVHDSVFVHDTVALRVDSIRVIERAGNAACALPAVVVLVELPEHKNMREPVLHGHYRVRADNGPMAVVATPPNARPGDVVCILEGN